MAWVAAGVLGAAGAVALGRAVLAVLSSAPVSLAEVAQRLSLTVAVALLAVPALVRTERALVARHLA
jgi:hypothetical protein